MNILDKKVSRKQVLAGVGVAGISLLAGNTLLGSSEKASASATGDYSGVVYPQQFGDVFTTNYAANRDLIQQAADYAKQTKSTLYFPAGIYKISKTLSFELINVDAAFGAEIWHFPDTNNEDCIVVTGADKSRTKIQNLAIKGQQDGHTFGRHLLTIQKGDYITIQDVYIEDSVKDGVHITCGGSYSWLENLLFINVRVQDAGQDAFQFIIGANITEVFINQVTLINCESRNAVRHTLSMINLSTGSSSIKLSCFRFINCEFAGLASSEPLVKIQANEGVGASIENVAFIDSVVEQRESNRTGAAIQIAGKMQGLFSFENSNTYGTTGGRIIGYEKFPHYHIRDINSGGVPLLTSYSGIYRRHRTASLIQNAYEDTLPVTAGDIFKGYVYDSENTGSHRSEFTIFHGTQIHPLYSQNVTVTLVSGKIRVTNNSAASTKIDVVLQRVTKNYDYIV